MAAVWKIYALIDPRTGEPRYVGQTKTSLSTRLRNHIRQNDGTHKYNWLNKLVTAGLLPVIRELYTCYDSKTADASELFFMADFKARGFSLTNHKTGDASFRITYDGVTRTKMSKAWTPERRAAASKMMRERVITDELRAKLSAGQKKRIAKYGPPTSGRSPSPETRAKMRAAKLGGKHTAEHRANLSAAQKAIKRTPKRLAQLQEANNKRWADYRAAKLEASKCQ